MEVLKPERSGPLFQPSDVLNTGSVNAVIIAACVCRFTGKHLSPILLSCPWRRKAPQHVLTGTSAGIAPYAANGRVSRAQQLREHHRVFFFLIMWTNTMSVSAFGVYNPDGAWRLPIDGVAAGVSPTTAHVCARNNFEHWMTSCVRGCFHNYAIQSLGIPLNGPSVDEKRSIRFALECYVWRASCAACFHPVD